MNEMQHKLLSLQLLSYYNHWHTVQRCPYLLETADSCGSAATLDCTSDCCGDTDDDTSPSLLSTDTSCSVLLGDSFPQGGTTVLSPDATSASVFFGDSVSFTSVDVSGGVMTSLVGSCGVAAAASSALSLTTSSVMSVSTLATFASLEALQVQRHRL